LPLTLVPLCAIFVLSATAVSDARNLELRGRVEPAPTRAMVSIEGVATSFTATTALDSKGRFRFRRVPRGAYVVSVFVPGSGMTRRSVDVTPSLAGPGGRVELIIPFSATTVSATRTPQNRGTVSVSELAIPARAVRNSRMHRRVCGSKIFRVRPAI
jgi:hypothetical protein